MSKLLHAILTLAVIACFAGAAYMGYLFFMEEKITHDVNSQAKSLRKNVSVVSIIEPLRQTPTVTSPISNAVEPEAETVENDTELIAILAEATPIVPEAECSPAPSLPPEQTEVSPAEPTPTPYEPTVCVDTFLSVNFEELQTVNSDLRAWIFQEGTELNYPIMQHKDNIYYLTHLFDRTENKAGCLFMDADNDGAFTDDLTFVYGHNRKDATMFASIPSYQDQAYFEAHPTFELATPDGNYRAEIFAMIRVSYLEGIDWRPRTFADQAEFDGYVETLLERSYLDTGIVPVWGKDKLIALATCTNEVHDDRYILYARLRWEEPTPDVELFTATKAYFDQLEGFSRVIDVPGRGPMQYYAQNDPIWKDMLYEERGSKKNRRLSGSGCVPTSLCIVMANLVPDADTYWQMGADVLTGDPDATRSFIFCVDSVNQYFCRHTHAPYTLQTGEEFRRYLPVAMASFAAGNNCWGNSWRLQSGGTSSGFYARIAEIFGLKLTVASGWDEAITFLQNGGIAVVTTGEGNPYTGGGHYMAAVAADDDYLYIMDPYMKDDYSKTDKRRLITIIEPGLIRVNLSDMRQLQLAKFYLFEKP